MRLLNITVVGDSLVGIYNNNTPEGGRETIPVSEVRDVAFRKFDGTLSVAAALGVVAVSVALVVALLLLWISSLQ